MKYSNKQKNIHHQNANFTKDLFKNHFYTHTYTRTGKGNFPHNAFIITKKNKDNMSSNRKICYKLLHTELYDILSMEKKIDMKYNSITDVA